ncbi:hypothetical protein [Mycoplasma hafezii]|uniref:hypothetical protein n=1 Tax=Mycoplasma hafezii TaxID=525886 RepID=UPI003CFB922D
MYKKVTPVSNIEEIRNKISDKVKQQFADYLQTSVIEKVNKIQNSFFYKYWWVGFATALDISLILFIIFGFVDLAVLLIPIFILWVICFLLVFYRRKLKKRIRKIIESSFDQQITDEILETAFEDIDELEYIGATSNIPDNCGFNIKFFEDARDFSIPSSARIKNIGLIYHFKLLDRYDFYTVNVLFSWIVSNGKTSTEVTRAMQYYYCYLNDLEPNMEFDFSLFTKNLNDKNHKTQKLENDVFNKYVKLCSNDEIKARMLYTNYAQEMTLQHLYNVREAIQNNDLMYQNFWIAVLSSQIIAAHCTQDYQDQLKVTFNGKKITEQEIIDNLYKNIETDIYAVYATAAFITCLPFL